MIGHKHTFYALGIALLSACGGGGDGSSTVTQTTLSGLATRGLALGGASVTAKCATGAALNTTAAVDGSFSFSLTNAQSLPCILKAQSGSNALYGYAVDHGRVNITPLSDLALTAAGRDAPSEIFAAFTSATASGINAQMANAKLYLRNQIAKLDFNAVDTDPLTGTFAIGDATHQVLVQLDAALTSSGGQTQDDLRAIAKSSGELNAALPTGRIVISEIASGFYDDSPYWFEIVNIGNAPVNLSGYMVNTGQSVLGINPSTVAGRQSFRLPDVSVAPGAFLVISGERRDKVPNTAQIVHISEGRAPIKYPYWTSSGSIELVKDGVTRSFVRFGTNTDMPTTGAAPRAAPALPNAADAFGYAIVLSGKAATDIDPAGAWQSVSWTTPAGPNDVPAGAVDADGDGIPDSAEVPGGSFAGMNLYAMGVRAGKRDILIQVDYMDSPDPGLTPRKEAMDNVKASFGANGVNMVIDVGDLFGAFDTQYNWGGGKKVTYTKCVSIRPLVRPSTPPCSGDLYQYKQRSMDLRRVSIFHYALFGSSQEPDGSSGSSGLAELPGNDLLITLGGVGLNTNTTGSTNTLINVQAGTFMHELGHNLNLDHGGDEIVNNKPNYFSVMNYLYQFDGLGRDARGLEPFQRWKSNIQGDQSGDLKNDDRTDLGSLALNFSNGTSRVLDEYYLQESLNIGRGANSGVFADWNGNQALDTRPYALDINNDGMLNQLTDFDDWANISLAFNRNYPGAFGARERRLSTTRRVVDPMSNDRQPVIVETTRAPRM